MPTGTSISFQTRIDFTICGRSLCKEIFLLVSNLRRNILLQRALVVAMRPHWCIPLFEVILVNYADGDRYLLQTRIDFIFFERAENNEILLQKINKNFSG